MRFRRSATPAIAGAVALVASLAMSSPAQAVDTYFEGDPEAPVCTQFASGCDALHLAQRTASDMRDPAPVDGIELVPIDLFEQNQVGALDDIISADGRNGDVIIDVTGQGRRIDAWRSYAYQMPGDGCLRPSLTFWIRYAESSSTWRPLAQAAYQGPCHRVPQGAYATKWQARYPGRLPGYAGNRDQLCNTWSSPMGGAPCILIKG